MTATAAREAWNSTQQRGGQQQPDLQNLDSNYIFPLFPTAPLLSFSPFGSKVEVFLDLPFPLDFEVFLLHIF